ncbi:MAG: hypothetical protein HYT12_04285 [Candidatus Liptonbacteria bacterium]|nr:hypothetical protein [Candidatus Liptonbacteria bacterium]
MQIKYFNIKIKLLVFALALFELFASPTFVGAAELYFYPAEQTLVTGETAIVEVRLNTEGKSINAVEVSGVAMDPLEFLEAEFSGSFLPVVVEKPEFKDGNFRFVGGVPNGFVGDGIIGRLIVRARGEGASELSFAGARLFLNSENPEEIIPKFGSAKLLMAPKAADYIALSSKSHSEDKWDTHQTLYIAWDAKQEKEYSYRLSKSPADAPDATPDLPAGDIKFEGLEDGIYYFTICELHKNETGESACGTVSRFRAMIDLTAPVWISAHVSEGIPETESQKFVSFIANDNISGVNRYEISVDSSGFKPVESPHVLVDEDAEIAVLKAIDRAGNETAKIIELSPKTSGKKYIYILLALAVSGLIGLILRKRL